MDGPSWVGGGSCSSGIRPRIIASSISPSCSSNIAWWVSITSSNEFSSFILFTASSISPFGLSHSSEEPATKAELSPPAGESNLAFFYTPTLETGSSGLETAFNLLFCPTFQYNNFAPLLTRQICGTNRGCWSLPPLLSEIHLSLLWFVGAAGWDDHRVNLDSWTPASPPKVWIPEIAQIYLSQHIQSTQYIYLSIPPCTLLNPRATKAFELLLVCWVGTPSNPCTSPGGRTRLGGRPCELYIYIYKPAVHSESPFYLDHII